MKIFLHLYFASQFQLRFRTISQRCTYCVVSGNMSHKVLAHAHTVCKFLFSFKMSASREDIN